MGVFGELKRRNVFRVAVAYTVGSWFIAQIADVVLNNIGAPDWVIKSLFLLLAIGFIASLIISWAYEITPEGIKREHEVIRDASITHLTARKLDYVTLAAVLGVAIMFGWQQLGNEQPTAESVSTSATTHDESARASAKLGDQSIAVLPFANRSNREEDLFFTDGIHDDLLTQLAKISDLKVISRTSVMQYRDTDKRVPEIARELGVANVLEGGVQRAGQRIRINAQLIDVATDQHLWAETFDREMTIDNLFDIQTEIARQIVTAVKGQLTTEEQQAFAAAPTQSLAAYEDYLRARNLLTSSGYNIEKYLAAQPYAEQAVALDPNFALAYLLLAELHGNAVWIGYDDSPERKEAAQTALNKAASILPAESPDLLAAQSEFLYRFEQNYAASRIKLLKARASMPGDAVILEKLGFTQRRLGLYEEAVDSFLRSVELDPGNASAMSGAAETLAVMQQWSRLEEMLSTSHKRFGNNTDIASIDAMLPLWSQGDVETARARFDNVRADSGANYATFSVELPWYEHDFAKVVKSLNRPEIFDLHSISGWAGWRELNLANAYLQLGETDKADQLLNEVVLLLSTLDRDRLPQIVASELGILAEALALQGQKSRAIEVAEEALQLYSPERDIYEGQWSLQNLCKVLALTGEKDRALDLIAQLIDQPNGYVRWQMYLDPRWDFFRDDERFNDLIRPHNLDARPGSTVTSSSH